MPWQYKLTESALIIRLMRTLQYYVSNLNPTGFTLILKDENFHLQSNTRLFLKLLTLVHFYYSTYKPDESEFMGIVDTLVRYLANRTRIKCMEVLRLMVYF